MSSPRADGGDLCAARPGAEVGRAPVSPRERRRFGAGRGARGLRGRRAAVPGTVLMTTTSAGSRSSRYWSAPWPPCTCRWATTYRIISAEKDNRVEAADLPAVWRRPRSGQNWGCVRPQRARLLGDQHPVLFVFRKAGAGRAATASQRSGHADDAGAGVEHGDQLRDQYQLAGSLRWSPPRATSCKWPGLAVQNFVSAAVAGGWAVALVWEGSPVRPPSWATSGSTWSMHTAHPAADRCRRRDHPAAGGAIQNFHLHDQVVDTLAGAPGPSPGGLVASQRPSANWAPMAAGLHHLAHPFGRTRTTLDQLDRDLPAAGDGFSLPRTFGRMVESRKQAMRSPPWMGSRADQRQPDARFQLRPTARFDRGRFGMEGWSSASGWPIPRSSPTPPP